MCARDLGDLGDLDRNADWQTRHHLMLTSRGSIDHGESENGWLWDDGWMDGWGFVESKAFRRLTRIGVKCWRAGWKRRKEIACKDTLRLFLVQDTYASVVFK